MLVEVVLQIKKKNTLLASRQSMHSLKACDDIRIKISSSAFPVPPQAYLPRRQCRWLSLVRENTNSLLLPHGRTGGACCCSPLVRCSAGTTGGFLMLPRRSACAVVCSRKSDCSHGIATTRYRRWLAKGSSQRHPRMMSCHRCGVVHGERHGGFQLRRINLRGTRGSRQKHFVLHQGLPVKTVKMHFHYLLRCEPDGQPPPWSLPAPPPQH